jgi:HD-GYP domain-containing protein (c-di-GMP phosphodiesterase class II)
MDDSSRGAYATAPAAPQGGDAYDSPMSGSLAGARTLQDEIASVHECLKRQLPLVERIAVALYDPVRDTLKTFVNSTDGGSPIAHYEVTLESTPSLKAIALSGRPRVLDEMRELEGSPSEHTRLLLQKGYRSSYTLPVFEDGQLFGFLFFDASVPGYFDPQVVEHLDVFARLLSLSLSQAFSETRLLESALRVVTRLTHYRDPETRGHLDRMAQYSRIVAKGVAAASGLSDEYVESILRFSPLHDIGKIAVPDSILLKQSALTPSEFAVMQTHATKGAEIIEGIVQEMDLGSVIHIDMLRNVVLFHHESMDGSGYPQGRRGAEIPFEARIVKVADVFDALTSRRPYKDAWSIDEALAFMTTRSGNLFDGDCVAALVAGRNEAAAVVSSVVDASDSEQSHEGYSLEL